MFRVADIFSLSDFQRTTREHVRRLRETGRPEVLTVNGRAELVVYDAAAYQEIADRLERRERRRGVAALEGPPAGTARGTPANSPDARGYCHCGRRPRRCPA